MENENPYAAPTTNPTPETSFDAGALPLATLGSRFLGAFVDGIVMIAISVPLIFLAFGIVGIENTGGMFEMMQGGTLLTTVISTVLSWGIYIAINYHFWATRGQSIGKMAAGTKIVRTDGSKADVGRIIGHRFLAISALGLIPFIGGFVGLVDTLMIFRKDRNCLHDDIADTRVIIAGKRG